MNPAQSLEQALFYFMGMGLLHFMFFLAACWVLALSPRPQWDVWRRKSGRLALFLVLLLVAGAVFNFLWWSFIYERLYFSADPFIEFSPYLPITRGVVEAPFGNYRGRLLGSTTYTELYFMWTIFALGTWGTTIFFYRSLCSLFRQEPVQA